MWSISTTDIFPRSMRQLNLKTCHTCGIARIYTDLLTLFRFGGFLHSLPLPPNWLHSRPNQKGSWKRQVIKMLSI